MYKYTNSTHGFTSARLTRTMESGRLYPKIKHTTAPAHALAVTILSAELAKNKNTASKRQRVLFNTAIWCAQTRRETDEIGVNIQGAK